MEPISCKFSLGLSKDVFVEIVESLLLVFSDHINHLCGSDIVLVEEGQTVSQTSDQGWLKLLSQCIILVEINEDLESRLHILALEKLLSLLHESVLDVLVVSNLIHDDCFVKEVLKLLWFRDPNKLINYLSTHHKEHSRDTCDLEAVCDLRELVNVDLHKLESALVFDGDLLKSRSQLLAWSAPTN